jgi:hypothetical protein
MNSVKHEIVNAIQTLNYTKSDLREIPFGEAKPILKSIKDTFTTDQNARWWWNCFRENISRFSQRFDNSWEQLVKIVPNPEEKVWFVVEEDQPDIFRVYLGKVNVIQNILGQCFGFEYYLVDCALEWLICVNHHDYIIALGNEVVENLQKLTS